MYISFKLTLSIVFVISFIVNKDFELSNDILSKLIIEAKLSSLSLLNFSISKESLIFNLDSLNSKLEFIS